MKRGVPIVALWVAGLGWACDEDAGRTDRSLDALAYDEGGFRRVTREARPSQHMGADVHIWVSDGAVEDYLAAQRGNATSDIVFAEGAMIVKEQLAADGGPPSLTVMLKGAKGSGPDSDDWFWERIEADGGVTFSGQVDFCLACHTPRRETDWIFGVEDDNRLP